MRFRYLMIFAIALVLLAQAGHATHQIEYRVPTSIITTVGKPTTLQIDIKNAGSSAEYYLVAITAALPNEMEITNPNIQTKTLNPGESVSVFSNIRALTENPNPLTVKVYRDNDLSHFAPVPPIVISVNSKKFSLPEFGLGGFLQIIVMAAAVYFFLTKNSVKAIGRKNFSPHQLFQIRSQDSY